MTPENGLPLRTERQLAHSQPDDIQTRVAFICIKRPTADHEPFTGLGIANDLHRHLETRKTFEEFSRIGREISIFVGGRLKFRSYPADGQL